MHKKTNFFLLSLMFAIVAGMAGCGEPTVPQEEIKSPAPPGGMPKGDGPQAPPAPTE